MSAESIAGWNAIPFSRRDAFDKLKPLTSQDMDTRDLEKNAGDGGEDDDISLVSRTPSPPVHNVEGDLTKYDEYVRGTAREVITVDTKIKPSNKGYALLTKLGWSEGQPLGLSSDGRTEPIPFHVKADLTGLGKINQDVRMIETTVSQRRELDSERQQKETEEQRQAREDSVLRRVALQTEITSTLKAFYCTLCEKQFRTVAQYDEHTNSYAHHHKARFRDLKASLRIVPQEDVDRRKEKERKREEKELRKIAAAAGVRMAKTATQPAPSPSLNILVDHSSGNDPPPAKKSVWSGASSSAESSATQAGFKKRSWSAVGFASSVDTLTSETTRVGPPTPLVAAAPSFRAAGWVSLEIGTASPNPFPPLSPTPMPPKSSASPQPSEGDELGSSQYTTPPLPPSNPTPPSPRQPPPATSNQGRSSWQQFKYAGAKRRRQ